MPIILLLVGGLFLPRITIFVLWFLSAWFSGVFSNWVWPLLGFVFMPYTMLWYSVVHNVLGGVWGPGALVGMILAIAFDLSSSGYGYRRYYVADGEVVEVIE